jgi:hypothetical protein
MKPEIAVEPEGTAGAPARERPGKFSQDVDDRSLKLPILLVLDD